jgi:hypothetical protein
LPWTSALGNELSTTCRNGLSEGMNLHDAG